MKFVYIFFTLLIFTSSLTAQQPRLAIRSYATKAAGEKTGKYTMEQFLGRWQETDRVNTKTMGKATVTDTFFIHFYAEGKATTKQGNSVEITGSSELFTDGYITTSANDFKIISVTYDKIVLDDLTGFQHLFSKTNLFNYEVLEPLPVAVVDTAGAIIDLSSMVLIKDWFAYKRDATPGFVTSSTPVIRNLRIQKKVSESSYSGVIEYALFGKANVEACRLNFKNSMLLLTAPGNTWNIDVYKSDGKEMILGKKGELVYYFKNGN